MTPHKRPVLLYEPRGPGLDLPVDLLLASARIEDREVALVDGRFEVAPEGRVVERCRDAAMLVVAAPGGAALLDAQRISRSARAARADLFVLWLGAHATARPDECLRGGADACAVGPAEDTLPELLAALDAGGDARAVPGLAVAGASGASLTSSRAGFGPPPAPARYDRLDLDRHFRWRGERRVQYRSSRVEPGTGSPGAWRWAGLAAERVVADLAGLVPKQRVAAIDFVDEEFFADLRRAEAIARGLIAAGVRVAWTARGRVETLRLLTEEAVLVLRQAGCERITVDAVSGSAAVRARVPGAPDAGAVRELACKLARGALPARFEFAAGLPAEPPSALHETFQLARELHRMGVGTATPIAIWRPRATPGPNLEAPESPTDLAGWAELERREPEWAGAAVRRWAPRFDFYLRMANERPRRGVGRLLIHWLARLRVATGVYGLDFERALVELSRRLRTANKAARPGSIGWEP